MTSETIGNATLYLGDCRDILPEIQADVMITDPVWPNCPPDLLRGGDDPAGLMRETLELLNPVRRMVIVMRHDSDPRFLSVVPSSTPFFRIQILPYALPGYIGRKLGGDEVAYCFGEPLPSAPGGRVIPGYAPKAQPTRRTIHPCARSLDHFRWLTRWWSLEGETVLDPFMGSGTTIVAAVESGRRGIGIEIESTYYDIARRRVEEAQRQQVIQYT